MHLRWLIAYIIHDYTSHLEFAMVVTVHVPLEHQIFRFFQHHEIRAVERPDDRITTHATDLMVVNCRGNHKLPEQLV